MKCKIESLCCEKRPGERPDFCDELCEEFVSADLPEAGASAERISSVVRLLPCPFCGSVGCCVNNHGNKYFVVCNCGTQTDNYDTVDKAIIFWNTRQ